MKKTIKQYCYNINNEDMKQLKEIAYRYVNIKNYFYSRYSGIKSYNLLFSREIRNNLVKNIDNKIIEFNLPARYWKIALDECIGNIKSNWSNSINKVKKFVRDNEKLTKDEKHYIYYVLKSPELLYKVLNHIDFEIPEKIRFDNVNYLKLNKLIQRLIRKYKTNISYSKKSNNFSIDTNMYSYNKGNLLIQSLLKGKRIILKPNTDQILNKTLKIILNKNHIEISCPIDIKEKENNNIDIIGVDKNYENVITTSNGNIYGDGINKIFNKYTDLVNENNSKKINLRLLRDKYKESNPQKYNNIIKNNLGNVKYKIRVNNVKEQFKSIINKSINEFIEKEKPKTIILEDLSFQTKKKKPKTNNNFKNSKAIRTKSRVINKKVKNKLSSWCKGYIQERLEYRSYVNNMVIKLINAAYTSQICSHCGFFLGKRSETDEFNCPNCGEGLNVHYNSAMNIKNRFDDKEIDLYTKYTDVRTILLNRNKRMLELRNSGTKIKTEPSKTLETESCQSVSELSLNL